MLMKMAEWLLALVERCVFWTPRKEKRRHHRVYDGWF